MRLTLFGKANAFASLSKAHMLTVSDDEARLNFSDFFFFIKVLTGRIIVLQTEVFDCRGAVCTSAGEQCLPQWETDIPRRAEFPIP